MIGENRGFHVFGQIQQSERNLITGLLKGLFQVNILHRLQCPIHNGTIKTVYLINNVKDILVFLGLQL